MAITPKNPQTPVDGEIDKAGTEGQAQDPSAANGETSGAPSETAADNLAEETAAAAENPAPLSGAFTFKDAHDFEKEGLLIVEDPNLIERLAEGTEFFAAYIHDPRKSGDHYEVLNVYGALLEGKVVRRGMPVEYWRDWSSARPPVMRVVKGKAVLVA